MNAGRRELTPVTITRSLPNHRTRRVEAWEAVSVDAGGDEDGAWLYRRLEEPRTPWEIEHLPTGRVALWRGNLEDARAATADGTALSEIGLKPAA